MFTCRGSAFVDIVHHTKHKHAPFLVCAFCATRIMIVPSLNTYDRVTWILLVIRLCAESLSPVTGSVHVQEDSHFTKVFTFIRMRLEPTELNPLNIFYAVPHKSRRLECSRSQSNVAYGQQARLLSFHCYLLLALCAHFWSPITESAKVQKSASTKVLHVTHVYYSNETFV